MEAFKPVMLGGIHESRRAHKSHPLPLLKVCSFDCIKEWIRKGSPKKKFWGVIRISDKDP